MTRRFPALSDVVFELHAGRAYCDAIVPGIESGGATVERPLAGLGVGQQLAWYGD